MLSGRGASAGQEHSFIGTIRGRLNPKDLGQTGRRDSSQPCRYRNYRFTRRLDRDRTVLEKVSLVPKEQSLANNLRFCIGSHVRRIRFRT